MSLTMRNETAVLESIMSRATVDRDGYANLYQLAAHGPREAGELPRKHALPELLGRGWVVMNEGDAPYAITYQGMNAFLEGHERFTDDNFRLFGVLSVGFAEICGQGELDGQPLRALGGCLDWVKEHVLGKSLVWAEHFNAYDYATFDFTHPITGVKTHLKPDDFIVLKEDGNHVVHKFSEE